MTRFPTRGLYAITSADARGGVQAATERAIQGGASAIQYRNKEADDTQRSFEAAALVRLCQSYGVPLIVNDDVELARRVGADGVHLGKGDSSVETARTVLGSDAIIGMSCYDRKERAIGAQAAGVTYVAFGSFFPSRTKPKAVPATLELLRAARPALRLPIVAIGGITPENGKALLEAGADLLAVIRGVFGQDNERAAAARYAAIFAR